jgi:CubicO group peptidase (beta-lactamase class C family)
MQTLVFDPLAMNATSFDLAKVQDGNVAKAHAPDIDGQPALAEDRTNLAIVPVRPAGGAWSSVNDVMKYVAMELAEGKLPNGKQYIGKDPLLARREPQVAIGTDVTYGMGLSVSKQYDVTVVYHGGGMIGFHSDMMWLPEHGVGAVILTNGDPGWLVPTVFRRKLLEVLFDGNSEADGQITAASKTYYDQLAAERKLTTVPADPAEAGKLSSTYTHPAVGEIVVTRKGTTTTFDFGEWSSEMASRKNPDGTISFMTIAPGLIGLEFVAGDRTLTLRDAQHEYVYTAAVN